MKIVTLGEIMLRLSPANNARFIQASAMDVIFGGGEANVAVSLSHYGNESYFVSKVPEHEIGEAALMALKANGVITQYVVRGGDRLGIYFSENGASVRSSKVIYDRAHSAISLASVDEFDFETIFKDVDWFHFSGITPALSPSAARITKKALEVAKRMGVTVSCDLNYRAKLWDSETAIKTMTPLMQYVDVCIGNEEDAAKCLGFVPESDVEKGKTDVEAYYSIFQQLHKTFGFSYIAATLRESHSASDNGWKALLYDGVNFYTSKHYDIKPIVDRIGAGDSFSGGLIHGLLHFKDLQKTIDFATAASALKQTIPGDFNMVSEKEVLALMQSGGHGRVER